MAHERLRFPVLLNNTNHSEETVYQPIFSDQGYGTHFGLFANFKGKPVDDGYHLDGMEIKIQGYTGDVTLGITKVLGHREKALPDQFKLTGFSTGRLIKLYVLLQAFNHNSIANYPEKIATGDAKGDGGEENQEAAASPSLNLLLRHGDVVEVTVLYEPVANEISQIKEDPDTRNTYSLFADPKFLFRDGEEIGWLTGAKEKMEIIELAKKEGLDAAIALADSRELHSFVAESFTEEDLEDRLFGAIGGGRPCKMKLSDVYILR